MSTSGHWGTLHTKLRCLACSVWMQPYPELATLQSIIWLCCGAGGCRGWHASTSSQRTSASRTSCSINLPSCSRPPIAFLSPAPCLCWATGYLPHLAGHQRKSLRNGCASHAQHNVRSLQPQLVHCKWLHNPCAMLQLLMHPVNRCRRKETS